MFRRIVVEEWQNTMTIAAFVLFFCSFLIALLRALATPKAQLDKLKNLPLESDHAQNETAN